jgi:hypothetical protein
VRSGPNQASLQAYVRPRDSRNSHFPNESSVDLWCRANGFLRLYFRRLSYHSYLISFG